MSGPADNGGKHLSLRQSSSPVEGSRGHHAFSGPNSSESNLKTPVPQWLPVSLLALTTAALAVPIFLLRRHRPANLGRSLSSAPPPPRRAGAVVGAVLAAPPRLVPSPPAARPSTRPPSTSPGLGTATEAGAEDNFNGALFSAKAFGIATMFVTVGAGTTIWGVKSAMGVGNTQEFADRMRSFILTRMPALSARIHRLLGDDNSTAAASTQVHSTAPALLLQSDANGLMHWSWPDAERRLNAAYERDGFMGWAQAALQELEAEGQVERAKRGHV